MSRVVRVRVPSYVVVDVGPGSVTLYPFEVMLDNGKIRKVSKRYSDVHDFHQTILKAAPHPALESFNFPHKSMFNTFAGFTKERRRSGFEEYFELLLRLGPAYAPFVATFLKDDDDGFDEVGDAPPVTPVVVVEDKVVLAASVSEWLVEFYAPSCAVAALYVVLLWVVGGITTARDWDAACLAVATAPLVLTIVLSFVAPIIL